MNDLVTPLRSSDARREISRLVRRGFDFAATLLLAICLGLWANCTSFGCGLPEKAGSQPSKPEEPGSAETPSPSAATEAAGPEAQAGTSIVNVDSESRTELNLLGQTDTASGESRRNENVQINLIDNNVLKELNERIGATATVVREFQADQTYFGAEFGGGPELPLHVAPAGSSSFHGNIYAAHNNSVFSARSFFQAGDVQPARENDYGFAAGLPLWRGAYVGVDASQQKIRGSVNGNVLVPRADERTPLATDPVVRAFVSQILNAYPAELPNRTDIDPRALNTNAPQIIDNDNVSAQLDQSLRDKDRLVFRYSLTTQAVEAFQLVAGRNPDTTTKSHDARVTWDRAWSAATTTDFSAGFRRIGSLLVADQARSGPLIFSGSALTGLGPGLSIPIDRAQNHFRYAGRLRHVRGNHQWTAGFEFFRRQVNGFESNLHSGLFSFRNDFGRDAITNLRLGTSSVYFASLGNVHRGFRNSDFQSYLGDSWRVTADLTLSFGLRYQFVTAPSEVNDLNVIPYFCDCNNFGPRFGFAYRPGARWGVVRGAYGVQYGAIFPVTFSTVRFNPPGNLRLGVQAPNLLNPLAGLDLDNLDPDTPATTFEFSPDLVSPYSHQYSFSWEFPLARDWTLDLGYVGSRTHKLFSIWAFNRAVPMAGVPQVTSTVNDRRPDPEFLETRQILNGSRAYFDAAKVTLLVPRWKGVSIDASYWFSKAIDLGGDYTTTGSELGVAGAESQWQFDVHRDLKSLSNFDQPHALLWRMVYEMPRLVSRPLWVRRSLGGWEFSGVFLFKRGTPFTVSAGSDAPGFGNVDGSTSDRPNLADAAILGRTVDDPDTSTASLPRSAFTFIEPSEAAGNLGRNVFRKDGIRNINAALARRWPLGGEKALTFRAESINLFNTPQFADPGTALADPNFGRITNTLNDGRTFRFFLQLAF